MIFTSNIRSFVEKTALHQSFRLKPVFEYLARLAFIASSAFSFGAALALDYLTDILNVPRDKL